MKTDSQIKEDVLDELSWQPHVDDTQIGVTVEKGVVTLNGIVDSYSKKIAAEKAVKNVSGVKAVAEDIEVKYGQSYRKTDQEIAKAAVSAMEWNVSVPASKINTKVEKGGVYLDGEVSWQYQKNAAKRSVENLMGVNYVVNNIKLKQPVEPKEIKERITKAFERSADIDAKNIRVTTEGHTVKLSGKVHSLQEKDNARRATYYAPGVYSVKNELEVEY